MSSNDPRDRKDLCGERLVAERTTEDLAEEYDPDTWYEADDGTHYCCRDVWEEANTDRCLWHADFEAKPPGALSAAQKDGPSRLDRAILRDSDLSSDFSFAGYRLFDADLSSADLKGAELSNAGLWGADLSNATLRGADLTGALLVDSNLLGSELITADLSGAVLRRANLQAAEMIGADLPEADLMHADLSEVNLAQADLRKANLRAVDMRNAKFGNADLRRAELTEGRFPDSTFQEADMRNANLERADFSRANLFYVDLTGAKLYSAVLANVQLNTDTEFGDHYTEDSDDPDPDKAAWTLRQLERLFRENALPEKAREAYLDRKDRRRQQYWNETIEALRADDPLPDRLRAVTHRARQWSRTALYGATMRYGESPRRVVTLSIGTVLAFGLVYPFFGGMDAGNETTTNYGFDPIVAGIDGLPAPVVDVLANLYFSAVTFTTLGYGDIQPATPVVELLAAGESFLGALLMALLVFVLGRRATW